MQHIFHVVDISIW